MKGWLAAAVLALLVATACGSFWLGTRWQKGRDAIAQLDDARDVVNAATQQLTDYGTAVKQSTLKFQNDAAALRAIAEDLANGNVQRQQFGVALTARLDRYLAAHPPRADCDIGPDGLQLWNDANQGAPVIEPAATAAAGAATGPVAVDALPGFATGFVWQIGRADAQPPADHGVLSRLPGFESRPRALDPKAPSAGSRAAAAGLDVIEQTHQALMKAAGNNW